MLRKRIIPCLLLVEDTLVKTVRFSRPNYIGDPINTARIFNELEVDELCLLDIRASAQQRDPSYDLLARLAEECFMPLSYGGGIRNFESAKRILASGFEKIILNTNAYRQPNLLEELAGYFGSQAIVASVDVKKSLWGRVQHYVNGGSEKTKCDPLDWAQELEKRGAGEILLTSIDREGTWSGFDLETVRRFTDALGIPVIANGGAGSVKDIADVLNIGGASAAAVGSMVVYQKKGMGILVSFPNKLEIETALNYHR